MPKASSTPADLRYCAHDAGSRHVILDFVRPYEERFEEIERFAAEAMPLLADLRRQQPVAS